MPLGQVALLHSLDGPDRTVWVPSHELVEFRLKLLAGRTLGHPEDQDSDAVGQRGVVPVGRQRSHHEQLYVSRDRGGSRPAACPGTILSSPTRSWQAGSAPDGRSPLTSTDVLPVAVHLIRVKLDDAPLTLCIDNSHCKESFSLSTCRDTPSSGELAGGNHMIERLLVPLALLVTGLVIGLMIALSTSHTVRFGALNPISSLGLYAGPPTCCTQ
jgi:hypothetical protein